MRLKDKKNTEVSGAIGIQLRGIRQETKIKVQEIADTLGVTLKQIHLFESGEQNIPLFTLKKWTKILRIKVIIGENVTLVEKDK